MRAALMNFEQTDHSDSTRLQVTEPERSESTLLGISGW